MARAVSLLRESHHAAITLSLSSIRPVKTFQKKNDPKDEALAKLGINGAHSPPSVRLPCHSLQGVGCDLTWGSQGNLALTIALCLLLQAVSPNLEKSSPPDVAPKPKARPRLEPSLSIQEKQGPLRDLFGPCSPSPPTTPAPPPPPPPALPLPLPEEPKTLPVESRGEESMFPVLSLFRLVAGLMTASLLGSIAKVIPVWLRPAVWASGLWSSGALDSSFLSRAGLRHLEACLALRD